MAKTKQTKTTFNVYEYPLKDREGNVYYGSYTIKDGVKPLHFKGEQLVDTFEAEVSKNEEM